MAIQENRRALELDPNLAQAHHAIGNIYLHYGLLDRAVEEFRRTLAIDPGNFGATRRIGLALVYRGRYEDGLRMIRQVPAQSNQSLWTYQVAWALLYLGRNAEASTLMERYLRDHPEDRGGWGLFQIGPVPEGMVTWFLAIVLLLLVARATGKRLQR